MTQLSKAFRALRKLGYFARQDFWCCQSCAWSAIPEAQAKRAVFYHAQDDENRAASEPFYLAWSGNAAEIVEVLRAHGITAEWNGKQDSRILVTGGYR